MAVGVGLVLKYLVLGYFASWRYQILGPFDIQAKCITQLNYVTRPDCN